MARTSRAKSTSAGSRSSRRLTSTPRSNGPVSTPGRSPSSPSRYARSRAKPRTDPGVPALPASETERVFREEYGRAVAVLVGVFGDIDVAEEAVQDAFTAAVQRWPSARSEEHTSELQSREKLV